VNAASSTKNRSTKNRSSVPVSRSVSVLPVASVSSNLPFVTTYAVDDRVDAWTALGDRSRRQIFERLAERPQSVTELAGTLPISRPAVSQHLRVLKTADLVRSRPEGTRRIYEVNHEGLSALRAELDVFWGKSLARFKELAEQEVDERTEESP
jgi:DNA-binding transcriptional ArsR family regulator